MGDPIEIRRLTAADIGLIGSIDRSEQLEIAYSVVGGKLIANASEFFVPQWDPVGSGDHSVASLIDLWEPVVAGGAAYLGAYRRDELLGVAIVSGAHWPGLAWLALLHVSRIHRRSGVAAALWENAVAIAVDAGSTKIYVSSAPTGSAVGFYSSRGCRLAAPEEIVPELYKLEPDDIHLMCVLD